MLKSPFKLYGQSFVASLGALVCGFTISQLGIAYNYLAENYYIDKFDKYGKVTAQFRNICTIVVAILSVGAMISAYFSKYIFHKLERRQIMILADFIFILGSILGLVQDQYAFTFARFIMGLSVGLNTTVILPYLREISPDNYSKKICSFFNNQFFNGVILGMVTSLPLKQFSSNDTPQNNLWMLVIIFPAYTPFFYYSNNMHYEGRKALERLYEENSVQELENSIIGGGVNQSDNKRSLIAFDSIVNQQKCPSQRNRLITGMCINFLQQMTGITMLMAYLTAVFGEVTDDFKKQNLLVLCGAFYRYSYQ
ncbi:major facilitator superfamily protein, putative [Ichthyophthirius multifiliis]|uniref:Major facilitator superfamily protein, putative n=1 Tax=Ichthyophthirius multifiliis TaxID=5932 RepID=G0QWB6_ICHMU|nr:major facilitator superfamily protein, putative [Ichthyophthirius multifiliis]EGR30488.1 major facilitator superfamily protein, putative [Ichthyophthirius multifiliis]|eukprot:XP_004032075.1 major facilitator superfamily protein, putative [Ichthyophthirius multifiliis]